MNPLPDKIKNILVVRNDRLGEFLLNIPALRAIKETFTKAKIIAVVNPVLGELAKDVPFLDEIICWGQVRHSLKEELLFIAQLRKRKIDMAVMLNPSKEFNILTYLAAIPIRVGYSRKWPFLLTHKIADRKLLGEKHEVEYNLELVSQVGAKTLDKKLVLNVDDRIIDDLLVNYEIKNNDRLIALHPWTSDPIKQWPLESFSNLIIKLKKDFKEKIIILGGKEEIEASKRFCDDNTGLINLTGKTNLRQLAAFLKKCLCLISNDSGPMHLAAAVGTPVVAIFRSDIPGKSAKRWGPWGSNHQILENESLGQITANDVLNKVKKILDLTHAQ